MEPKFQTQTILRREGKPQGFDSLQPYTICQRTPSTFADDQPLTPFSESALKINIQWFQLNASPKLKNKKERRFLCQLKQAVSAPGIDEPLEKR
jgi:hypothetical protein